MAAQLFGQTTRVAMGKRLLWEMVPKVMTQSWRPLDELSVSQPTALSDPPAMLEVFLITGVRIGVVLDSGACIRVLRTQLRKAQEQGSVRGGSFVLQVLSFSTCSILIKKLQRSCELLNRPLSIRSASSQLLRHPERTLNLIELLSFTPILIANRYSFTRPDQQETDLYRRSG